MGAKYSAPILSEPAMILCGVGQQTVERFLLFEFVAIGGFLTSNAERGLGHGVQPLEVDLFVAMHANPVRTFGDPG